MVFDRTKEPHFEQKIKVVSSTPFFDANGEKQSARQNPGEVTVFEVKEINQQIFYRIGGQKNWIPKKATDWGKEQVAVPHHRFTTTDLSKNIVPQPQKSTPDAERYNLKIKDGLAIQKGSKRPDAKEMRNLFKMGKTFPAATKFEWIFPPDTSQNKYTNAKLKVTFPDGSFKERSVHYNLLQAPQVKKQPLQPTQNTVVKLTNPSPQDLDFSFVKNNQLLKPFSRNLGEALRLYQEAYYKQMSNTIRQGLEVLTEQLLTLNQINPGPGWDRAILSNQLGYIAFLKLLPQRIMNLCYSIKNYGNIGSHHNEAAQINQASALTDLQQYHDLLVYLVNTYQNQHVPYADVQITDEQHKHRNWYYRPRFNPNYLTFAEFMDRKNQRQQPQPQIIQPTQPPMQMTQPVPTEPPAPAKEKMGTGMKLLISCFVILGLLIIGGIGYEVYRMNTNTTQSNTASSNTKTSLREQAAKLSTKQTVALSIIYADEKLDDQWQSAYSQLSGNGYNIDRYDSYTFGNETVSTQGNNYVYVVEKDVGFGYQDKGSGKRLVTFFDPDQSDPETNPVHAYTYQMLQQVKASGDMAKVNKLAKKLTFTDNEES